MALTIPVAHDVICPWCWIALFQVEKLKEELGVEFDWIGYELMPDELEWPEPKAPKEVDPRRPATPSRLDLAYAAQGMEAPTAERPKRMRSHNVLEALEYAKSVGVQDPFVSKIYRAYWLEGKAVNDMDVLACLAKGLMDVEELTSAVRDRRYKGKIIPFDDAAYAAGVFNVPTFFIRDQRYAEQPYAVLRDAIRKVMP